MKKCLKIRNKFMLFEIIACVCLIFLSGCSEYSKVNQDYYAGECVDSQRLQEIYESLSEAEIQTEIERETNSDGQFIVYWLDGGSVWHIDKNCRHISGKEIESGCESDALYSGIERVCSTCGGNNAGN